MLDEKSLKRSLELIEKQMIRDAYQRRNIDTFTELLMAVIKAFIYQARSGRSYMPTHAKFQGVINEENGLIDRVVLIMEAPNDKYIRVIITEDLDPECFYYYIIFMIQEYEQPKKDVNQYDNRSDKTST